MRSQAGQRISKAVAGPENRPAPASSHEREVEPGLWKLLVAAAGILVVVFIAMELVDDTYTLSPQGAVSAPVEDGTG